MGASHICQVLEFSDQWAAISIANDSQNPFFLQNERHFVKYFVSYISPKYCPRETNDTSFEVILLSIHGVLLLSVLRNSQE